MSTNKVLHATGNGRDAAPGVYGVASQADDDATGGRPARRGVSLRRVLALTDLLALVLAWSVTFATAQLFGDLDDDLLAELATAAGGVVATMLFLATQGLYRARVAGIRSIEIVRVGRSVVLAGLVVLTVPLIAGGPVAAGLVVVGSGVAFFALVISRGLYRAWLRQCRAEGRFCRRVVLVGADEESSELFDLIAQHPEAGYRVVGMAGPRSARARMPADMRWLGDLDDIVTVVEESGADSVFIASGAIGSRQLNSIARQLVALRVHVHLSSGIRGIGHRRLRSQPLAHEPFYYLEPVSLSRWHRVCKRTLDVTLTGLAGIVVAPIVGIAAIAVKFGDRGPVLFRQTRIGRDGQPFTLFKLRTMVPDAERQLVDLMRMNQRAGGPLFKAASDPRRTRVGRVLERTSIDELPQLWNVLRGDMSLVGPRPALPHEVASFDEEFLDRHRVLPGITGLWQVEGRDNPAFEVYRRLDLFYVENWTVGLDLAILLGTATTVLGRTVRSRRSRRAVPAELHPHESLEISLPDEEALEVETIAARAQAPDALSPTS
jgi:exopolysaccharide biosynthesis polyprenyl glycosylphosphotransferase